MKVILTIFLICTSFIGFNAQELSGYFVQEGTYSIEDSSYSQNNISGNSMTIEFFTSKSVKTNVIRIGHRTKIGTTYHDYVVVAAEEAQSADDYHVIVANDKFGGNVALKYNEEEFVLLYDYNEEVEQWIGYYSGMLLNRKSCLF